MAFNAPAITLDSEETTLRDIIKFAKNFNSQFVEGTEDKGGQDEDDSDEDDDDEVWFRPKFSSMLPLFQALLCVRRLCFDNLNLPRLSLAELLLHTYFLFYSI